MFLLHTCVWLSVHAIGLTSITDMFGKEEMKPSIPPQLLSRVLDDVNKEEWLLEFGSVLGNPEQVMSKYGNLPEEKVLVTTVSLVYVIVFVTILNHDFRSPSNSRY